MRPDDLVLRGYTIPDGDSYFAICLDLNIYARGDSPNEATERCFEFVCEYINEAVNEDAEYIADLLPRRAPLRFWLRFRYMQLIYWLFHRDGKDGGIFNKPLPVQIACP